MPWWGIAWLACGMASFGLVLLEDQFDEGLDFGPRSWIICILACLAAGPAGLILLSTMWLKGGW